MQHVKQAVSCGTVKELSAASDSRGAACEGCHFRCLLLKRSGLDEGWKPCSMCSTRYWTT